MNMSHVKFDFSQTIVFLHTGDLHFHSYVIGFFTAWGFPFCTCWTKHEVTRHLRARIPHFHLQAAIMRTNILTFERFTWFHMRSHQVWFVTCEFQTVSQFHMWLTIFHMWAKIWHVKIKWRMWTFSQVDHIHSYRTGVFHTWLTISECGDKMLHLKFFTVPHTFTCDWLYCL